MQSLSALSEYAPIKSLSLPGAELPEPSGIVVIVGPNSSGKTLLLRDVEKFLMTGPSSLVVCTGLSANKPRDVGAFVEELIGRRYIRPKPAQPVVYESYIPFMGSVLPGKPNQGRPSFDMNSLKSNAEKLEADPKSAAFFFGSIGQALVAPLSLDDRRKVCNRTNDFDHTRESPEHPLHGLKINSDAYTMLANETGHVFGNTVWMDLTERNVIQVRVSGTPHLPPVGDMMNPFGAAKYREIETEGDGYRSYVGICLSLLMGIRPVALVDEPELCLHPPQAYRIGRFIGRHASSTSQVTFVATHSSHVLRGILEASSGTKLTVVRMSRRGGGFWGRKVAEDELVDCMRNPRTRAEAVLDGLFARSVVLVESDGDREVYQAAFESVEDYASREIHFVPVGGTGGFADPCRFYRRLEIPVAIIADLDATCDPDKMISCVEALCEHPEDISGITEMLTDVARKVKALPPSITEDEVKETLRTLAALPMDWEGGDDNKLRRGLSDLDGRLRRLQRLKEGGVEAYSDHPEIKSALEALIQKCNGIGLFFVPCGELEGWVSGLMAGHSKRMNKIGRAALAASKIREAEIKQLHFPGVHARCEVTDKR